MLFQFLSHHVLCRRFTAVPSLVRSLHDIPLRSLPRLLASERVSSQSSLVPSIPIQVPFYHLLSMSIPHTLLLFRFSSFMTTPCQHNWSPSISDSRQLKSFLIQCISELDNSHSFPSIRSYPYLLRYFPGKSIPFLVLSCPHTSVSYRLVTPQFLAAKLRIKLRTFHTTTFIPNLIFNFSQNTLKRMKRTSATWTTISD